METKKTSRNSTLANDALLVQLGNAWNTNYDGGSMYNLFSKLERQAAKKGSRIIRLMGNNEVMNMQRWLNLLNPSDEDFRRHYKEEASDPSLYSKYGEVILHMPLCIKVNGRFFVHGGIELEDAMKSIERINIEEKQKLKEYLESLRNKVELVNIEIRDLPRCILWLYRSLLKTAQFDLKYKCNRVSILNAEGVLWTRKLASLEEDPKIVKKMLRLLGAKQIVIAHTTMSDKITLLYDNKVVLIDTGLSSVTHNKPSILRINQGGELHAIYPNKGIDFASPTEKKGKTSE